MKSKLTWKKALVKKEGSLLDAVHAINEGEIQIALVIDGSEKLVGTVTDGDCRRGLLTNMSLDTPLLSVMKTNPITAPNNISEIQLLDKMQKNNIKQIPIIDDLGRIIDIRIMSFDHRHDLIDNQVILMAGGFGRRLKNRTLHTPKPLLQIGDKPILNTILENFIESGFYNFTISIGHLGNQLEEYFGNGSKWGVNISYIKEEGPLGTAGSISLLKDKPKKPFFVMNGDVLTKVNFKQVLKFHENYKALATMCVRGFNNQLPYGVVNIDGEKIVGLEEKPIKKVMVNAGIYVLDPSILDHIKYNQFYNMTSLFEKLIETNKNTIAFPIHEYWMDIGQPEDFEQADRDYVNVFKDS